jgi:3-oxoacyl-[acyl-carrier-protein] synthase III
MSKIWIKEVSHYLPNNVLTNQDLIETYKIRMKSFVIEKMLGIKQRCWANENQAASDLAVEAAKKLDLENFEGGIFLSTISGDYPTPSTSSLIKSKLNLAGVAPAIDINNACAGMIFALELAMQRLQITEETQALVISSEVRSRFINKSDRRTAFLFADGASCFLIEENDRAPGTIEWVLTKTIASDNLEIYIPAGGSVKPLAQSVLDNNEHHIVMNDGPLIIEKTKTELVLAIRETLQKKNMTIGDYDYFIFHQGNENLIKKVCKELSININKVEIDFPIHGNTTSASVGISLSWAVSQGKIKKGDRVLIMSMGAGYHMGLVSVMWGY